MKSGIFAVVNIGQLRLYVGEMHQFQQRWDPLLQKLNEGQCKHSELQAEWNQHQRERKVTFHTLEDLKPETTLLRYGQFVKDIQAKQANV